jgi:hypothetical protein
VGMTMKTEDEIGIDEINGNKKVNYKIAKTCVYLYLAYLLLTIPILKNIIYCEK